MKVGIGTAAGDGHRAATVGKAQRAGYITHDAGGTHSIGSDGACRPEVFDDGILSVAERSGNCACCIIAVEGQRLAVAVEGALERAVLARASHHPNADVVGQLHVFAAMVDASVDTEGKLVPISRAGDEIRGVGCAAALSWPVWYGEDGMDVDVFLRHDERIAAGTTIAKKGEIVAVGIRDGNFSRRARSRGQRDLLMGAGSWNVILTVGADRHTALAYGGDVDGVGILDGLAVQVLTVGGIVLVRVERVVIILKRTTRGHDANPLVVLDVVDRHYAIESTV